MKHWILEKEGQLKLFLSIIIILSTTSAAQAEDKIQSYTDNEGDKIYTNEKQTQQPQNNQNKKTEQKTFRLADHPMFQKKEAIQQGKPIQRQQDQINIQYTKIHMNNELLKNLAEIEESFNILLSINLIISGPLLVMLSQLFIAIREIAINTRKEYNSEQSGYKWLYYTAHITMAIGWCLIPIGIILLFVYSNR